MVGRFLQLVFVVSVWMFCGVIQRADAAQNLVFTQQPGFTTAGQSIAPAVTVTVQDDQGTTVTTAVVEVTIQIGTEGSNGPATLSGTKVVTTVAGVATFGNLSIDKAASGYKLAASAAGLATVSSQPFAITSGAAAKISFLTQPVDTLANLALNPVIQIAVQDSFGNPVTSPNKTITLSLGSNPGGATLGGTVTRSSSAGVATFTGLTLNKVGLDYTIVASTSGFASITSNPFDIAFGPPSKLVFSAQPTDVLTNAMIHATGVKVTVQDVAGNTIVSPSYTVSLALTNGTAGATLLGAASLETTNGVATFPDLRVDRGGLNYTLQATATGGPAVTQATSSAFDVKYQIVFDIHPTSTVAGEPITPAVQVSLRDVNNATVPVATQNVTVSLSGISGATLSGTKTVAAVNGVATFSNLSVNKTGTGAKLSAAVSGSTTVSSSTFEVAVGPPAQLAFTVNPASTTAGATMAAVQVSVRDSQGNVNTTANHAVTVAIGTNPAGGTLSGTTTVNAVNGVAVLNTLSINRTGTGYRLSASAAGLTSATSNTFNITSGAAAQLAFTVQPADTLVQSTIAPAVKVAVQDALGNSVTVGGISVTLQIGENPGNGTLSGTLTATASSGVATFSNLKISAIGEGYTLLASAPGLAPAESNPFTIGYRLAFTAQPPSPTSAGGLHTVGVRVEDGAGSTIHDFVGDVTIAIQSPVPAGATLLGVTTLAINDGVALFQNVSIQKSGTFALVASGAGLVGAVSNSFTQIAYEGDHIEFVTQPQSGFVNSPLTVSARIVDVYGNTVTPGVYTIELLLGSNPASATMTGTLSANTVNGVATFSNVRINGAGEGFDIYALSYEFGNVRSTSFNLLYKVAFLQQATTATAGYPMTPAFKVRITDVNGVTATNINDGYLFIELANNPTGAELIGNIAMIPINGVATLDYLLLEKAAAGYTFRAYYTDYGDNPLSSDAISAPITVVGAFPDHLSFDVQPGLSVANDFITPTVAVAIKDAYDNLSPDVSTTVTLSLTTNPTGATLFGQTVVDSINGIATFPLVGIDKGGSGYKLAASSFVTGAVSQPFDVSYRLAFVVQPENTHAGAILFPWVEVAVVDGNGAVITGATEPITIALGAGPAGSLSGTLTRVPINGIATFDDVTVEGVSDNFTLVASASTYKSAVSIPFRNAYTLVFPNPVPSVVANGTLPPVRVEIQDALRTVRTDAVGNVTLSFALNPDNATLSGTLTAPLIDGVATFNTLSINKRVNGYYLLATVDGLFYSISTPFNVTGALQFKTQPASVALGSSITPAVTVAVVDAAGATITNATDSVTVALGTNPTGATLQGTKTVSAVNGVATFSSLSLNKIGTGYALSASATGAATVPSNTFAVTAGVPAQLAFISQPLSTSAGSNLNTAGVKVAVRDAFGNDVDSNIAVTLAFQWNPGGSTLSGTTTVNAVGGVATFTDLSANKVSSSNTLSASAPGLTSTMSANFVIVPGPAVALAFIAEPSNTTAGQSINPVVRVSTRDAFGNSNPTSFTATVSLASNPNGGTLAGTLTVNSDSGVSIFNNLSVDKAGNGYTLRVTAPGFSSATSGAFAVAAGAASRLAFVRHPSSAVAGTAISPSVQVAVQDPFGNTVTGATNAITVSLGTNPGGANVSGTKTMAAVAGIATFGDLSLDKASAGYTLAAAATSLSGVASNAFSILPAAPSQLAFSAAPPDVVAGVAMAPAVTVLLRDAFGNTANSTAPVTLSLASNPVNGTLSGTLTVNAVAGAASFANVKLDKAGAGYTLAAGASGLTGAISSAFSVAPGAPSALAFSVEPSNSIAGQAINPSVKVVVKDTFGNTVTGSSAPVTLVLNASNGAFLSGTTTSNAASGVASFADLSVDKAAAGYTVSASSAGLTPAASVAFAIAPGPASSIVFTGQPSAALAGAAISPSVAVTLFDAFGNLATAATDPITVALSPGGATLNGTTTVSAVAGVATFPDLSVSANGAGFTLIATRPGLPTATSAPFDVAFKLRFGVQPSTTAAGAPIQPAVTVRVVDAQENTIGSATQTVTLSLGSNPAGGALTGTVTVDTVGGVATFPNVRINKAGTGYTLSASAADATAASSAFAIVPGAAARLVFSTQPANGVSGALLNAVKVKAFDAHDNFVTTPVAVTVALETNAAGATLSGTRTVTTLAGEAVFNTLTMDLAGSGYTFRATSTGAASAVSNAFEVTPGAPARLVFTNSPVDTDIDSTLAAVQVAVLDAAGNRVVGATTQVAVTLLNSASSSVLHGTTLVAASGGVAEFSNLTIGRVGTGYRLQASAGGLIPAVSDPFNVRTGAPARLAWVIHPANTTANAPIQRLLVAVLDSAGNNVVSAANEVTLSIGNNPSAGALAGTTSAIAVNGEAAFEALTLDAAGLGYTLIASSPGLTPATSAPFNVAIQDVVTPGSPTITSQLTANPAQPIVGETVTFTVAAQDALALSYAWDFGNGATAATASGTVQHTFQVAGAYAVKVIVSNAAGKSVESALSVTVEPADEPTDDTDDITAGLNPLDFQVQQVTAKLSFASSNKDSLSIKGAIALQDGFTPQGQVIDWQIGGVLGTATLDAKGSASTTTTKVSVKFKVPRKGEPFTARTATLSIAVKKVTLSSFTLDDIPDLDTTTPGSNATLHARVVLRGHQAYANDTVSGIYKAKKGKSGAFAAKIK